MAVRQARSFVQALRLSSSHTQCVYPRSIFQLSPSRGFAAEHHGPHRVNFCEDLMSPSKWKEEHDWSFNKATDIVNRNPYKNNAAICASGEYSRKSQRGIEARVWIGRNIQELVTPTLFSMGSKVSFTGNLNIFGKSGSLVYTHHTRCYSSKQKRVMMDKRNIRDHKRRLLAEKYELKRMLYKAVLRDTSLPYDLREKFRTKLSKLPRNSSFVRVRNRCIFTARPRAVYREFRMSRIVFRELASKGALTGIRKASW